MQALNLTAPIIHGMSEFKDWQALKNFRLSDWLIGPFNFNWSLIGLCMKSKQWRVWEGSPRRPLFPIQYEMQLLCLTFYSQSATLDHPTHLISFLNKVLPWNGEIEGKVREAAVWTKWSHEWNRFRHLSGEGSGNHHRCWNPSFTTHFQHQTSNISRILNTFSSFIISHWLILFFQPLVV